MTKENAKKIFKVAVLIYLSSFLIINWNDISWIFNYREVSGLVSDFFNPYPSIDASAMNVYFYPNHSSASVQILPVQNLGGQGQVATVQPTANTTNTQTTVANQLVKEIKTNSEILKKIKSNLK